MCISNDADNVLIELGPNERYYDFNSLEIIPSIYVAANEENWHMIDYQQHRKVSSEEPTSEELANYAQCSESFKFLEDEAEDIYSDSDGKPI